MAKIQYTTPTGMSGELEFVAERMSIGRADDNTLVVPDESVSSHHGEVSLEGGAWYLADLGSTNGTKIGAERVDRIELAHGGVFSLGHVECVFVGDEAEADAPTAAYSQTAQTVTTGYGSQLYDRSARIGFGPKMTEKNPGAGLLILLGVLALIACGVSVYFSGQMAA